MEQRASWEANRFSACQEIPHIYGTRRFITAFARTRHLSLSWDSSIQSIPLHPTSWGSILILSSHLRVGHPRGLFPSVSPPKPCKRLSSPIRATSPSHFILLGLITLTILDEECRSLSSALCSFLHSPVTSSLLRSNNTIRNSVYKIQKGETYKQKSPTSITLKSLSTHCCNIPIATAQSVPLPGCGLHNPRFLLFPITSRLPNHLVPAGSFYQEKAAQTWSWPHEVTKAWSYSPTPSIRLHDLDGNKFALPCLTVTSPRSYYVNISKI